MRKRKEKTIERLNITGVALERKYVTGDKNQIVFMRGITPGEVVDMRIHQGKKTYLKGVIAHFKTFSYFLSIPSICITDYQHRKNTKFLCVC